MKTSLVFLLSVVIGFVFYFSNCTFAADIHLAKKTNT